MIYNINLFRMLLHMDDHIFRVKKAEVLKNTWKINVLLVLVSVLIYAWMAFLGIGTDIISSNATALSTSDYEYSKLWFIVGRMAYACLFVILLLFLPSLIFYFVTKVPFKKLIIMQQIVIFVMLIERVIWIPQIMLWGLDWYVSPFSLGILTSYFTEITWVIYFFGAISLFQIWIIWFQVKYISYLSDVKKVWIWVSVIFLHFIYWVLVSGLAFADVYLISGWFE